MGGKSSSSTSSDQYDNRTVGTDQAIVAGPNGSVAITGVDPGILDFGTEVLDRTGDLVSKALEGALSQSQSVSDKSNQNIIAALKAVDQDGGDSFAENALKFGLPALLLAGVAWGAFKR